MSLASPGLAVVNGAAFKLGIVASRFNGELIEALLSRVQGVLQAAGVKEKNVKLVRVPGSHEVPWAAQALAQGRRYDALVALGVLIGGDTNHHEVVGQSVSHALQRVALDSGTPVINGVIVTDTPAQARERCAGKIDRGAEFAHAALAMAALKKALFR